MTPSDLFALYSQDALWSGIAAIGFAILFNIPRRLLAGCFLVGAAGHTLRIILMSRGASIEISTLMRAVLIGFLSVYLSNHYQVRAFSFTVTGVISLVPGVFAYQTMNGLLNATSVIGEHSAELFVAAGISGVRTVLILAAIAFGITAPILMFRRSIAVV